MPETSEDLVENTGAVMAHVSVKPPTFYRQSPSTWFKQMESQFVLSHITKSETKFHHVLAALPEDIAMNLNLDDEADYNKLKETVINSLKANKHQLIEEAMAALELGDKRPSQLVNEIRRRFVDIGVTPEDTIIKSRLLSALPHSIRSALVGHDNVSVEQYAQIADSMIAVAKMSSSPFTVGKVEEKSHYSDRQSSSCANRNNYSGNRSQNKSSFCGVRPFYDGQRPRVCNGHIFYGNRSRTCRHWCEWPSRPSRMLKDNEKTPRNSRANSPTNC